MSAVSSPSPAADPGPDEEAIRSYLGALYGTADAGHLPLWTAEDRRTTWVPVADLDAAAFEVARLAGAGRNVYHGLGLHPSPLGPARRGAAGGVCAIPGAWIDLDVLGPAHAEAALPPTQDAALDLLGAVPLPPSLVVDSGHGLYAFWLFKEVWACGDAAERERAGSLLRRTQAAVREKARLSGWQLESTADLARVLRPVGAVNRKPNLPPVPVRLLVGGGDRYAVEELEDVLPDEPRDAAPPTGAAGRDEAGRADYGAVLAGCAFLRHCRDDAAGLTEPEWHAQITVVAQCRDGERLAHGLSAPYPRYDARETRRKYESARKADKPLRCDTIRRDRGGEAYCGGCPQWGRIASPIVLGYPRATPDGDRVGGPAGNPPSGEEPFGAAAPSGTFALTDYGNAERFVAHHGRDVRFCYAFTKWFVWEGRRWRVDDGGAVRRLAKRTVRAVLAEAQDAGTKEERAALARHALRSESAARLEALLLVAQSEPGVGVAPDDLDRDRWLLNAANGTVDLRTGELRPHDRADLLTKPVPVPYDPDAACPTWRAFLDRVLGGKADLVAFVQRAAGYSLTGDTGERALFVLWGLGRNGKSTLLEVLLGLLAGYAARTTTDTLLATRDGAIPNDVARLKGVRFVVASEAEEGRRLAEAKVKELTGGDTVTARFMRGEWFDFRPEFTLWLGTNHKPAIRGSDDAIWDRIRLIPFGVRIPDEEQDKGLRDKLLAEAPGILAWAVAGCLAWRRDGLGDPVAVREATSAYRHEMDLVGRFLEDRCAVRPAARATAKELYAAFQGWHAEAGEGDRPLSQKAFGQRLAARGFEAARVGKSRARYWVGVGLKGDVPEEDASDGADASGRASHDDVSSCDCREGDWGNASERVRRGEATAGEAGEDRWTR